MLIPNSLSRKEARFAEMNDSPSAIHVEISETVYGRSATASSLDSRSRA